jgi:chorismate synthase
MASNSFGNIFRITTWGESHGKGVGVVIDGCPAGLELSDDDINRALALRAPGNNPYTSPRKEPDIAEIYSGVFEGKTTGAPVSIIILNKDADSSKYEPIKNLLRPGHANYTYTEKYGSFDYRGGGRASARETACRVAAGAVANKILELQKIEIVSYMRSIGSVVMESSEIDLALMKEKTLASAIFCPDRIAENKMKESIENAKIAGDSLGGVVEFLVLNMPVGLGDPIYEKLEANLGKAMMSLPATKGFEIGEGFQASRMSGSEHNDEFTNALENITSTNHAGGTLAGISTGMPLIGRVSFKPTSSIKKVQNTIDDQGNQQKFMLPEGSRHDPCVAIRAVPIVSAMVSLVLVDALLMNRSSRL